MTAKELIEEIEKVAPVTLPTCDTVKSGEVNKEIKKVAVTMFPTVKVIREAFAWGADMMIVHEPTYYEHFEKFADTPVTRAKRELIEKSGIVIYRHHDRMHARVPDGITEGELSFLGLPAEFEKTPFPSNYITTLKEGITANELGLLIEERLSVKRVRIAGERNKKIKRLALCFGSPGGIFSTISREDVDSMLIGEVCEWQVAEYARDAAELGINKSVIVLGHVGSERDGMKLMCQRLAESHGVISFKYFECEEVYSFTDEPV